MKLRDFIVNHHIVIMLCIVFLIGALLRFARFYDNTIFGYDQARDAQRVYDMLTTHSPKLVGPETDIQGIFNGPFLYYLFAAIYIFTHFDPNAVSFVFILINLSGIFLLYKLAKTIFNNKYIGILAGLFWALSYEQANYAKFISNASLMSICTMIFFLGLAQYFLKKKSLGLIVSVVGLGLATHANIYLLYLILLYPILYFVYKPKLSLKYTLSSILLLGIILSPFALAELKWHFQAMHAAFNYLHQQKSSTSVLANFIQYYDRTSELISYSFFLLPKLISFLIYLGAALLFYFLYKKQEAKFVLMWLFSTFPLFAFHSGVITVPVINSSIFGAEMLVIGALVYTLLSSRKTIIVGSALILFIALSNTVLYAQDHFLNITRASSVPVLINDYKNIVNYTYTASNKQPYSICAVTEPLFINTLWSYIYNLYGKKQYGYLPYWSGQAQTLNINMLPYDTHHVPLRYLIIQPTGGLPKIAVQATVYMEDKVSVLDEEKLFGKVTVQKRHLTNDPTQLKDTQHLSPTLKQQLDTVVKNDPRYSCYHSF